MSKSSDSKREEFRKYLERGGVMEALTKSLVTLYMEPEKPNDALDWLRKQLSVTDTSATDLESLMTELTTWREKCEGLEQENQELKNYLQQLQAAQASNDASDQ